MHLLTFALGDEDYAIESRHVVEVLPMIAARPLRHSPAFVRGVFVHRGRLVPLVDLGVYFTGHAVSERLSTRVIVVEFAAARAEAGSAAAGACRLGLGAERVVSLATQVAPESVLSLAATETPCLGPVLRIEGRTVQLIRAEHILPPEAVAAIAACVATGPVPAAPPLPQPS